MKIAFAGVFAGHVADRVRTRLRIPCEVTLADDRDIVARLGDVDVLVSMAFTREMAAAAPRLRLVQVPGAGLDRIDRSALAPGTALANAYGHDVGIAEYVIGAMLAISRSFCRIDADLRRGQWDSVWSGAPVPLWPELAGKTLGILGYGRIGQAVARRALAFDMEVLAIRRDATRPDPHGLGFLRGPAALDVWYRYPTGDAPTHPGHRPFHALPNVLMTPHVSGWTEGMMDSRAGVIAENIHRAARGEAPLNHIR